MTTAVANIFGVAQLEAMLEQTAAPRIQCEPLGANGEPVLEPRIVKWLGWRVEHTWKWERGDIPHRVTVAGTRLRLLGDTGYAGMWIADTPFTPTPISPTNTLTLIQDVARPVIVP